MKIHVTYDEAGNIVALAIPSEDSGQAEDALATDPGEYSSEIELDSPRALTGDDLLTDLVQNYRVERSARATRLVRRSP